ncbi:hypothetical protein LTR37_001509 [Vermiconidia calcicola]|uniref:Uncharacterized protein n=1 Tax=Vermiconidia calcicola TaxID=1690605 RepID=A0ACC3NVG1_9PEZI|nr:hypothetical protein LTR37_001509 [Vermiconidia calcicola]
MKPTLITCELLLATAALALPEIRIGKKHKHKNSPARPVYGKRQVTDGTLDTTVYDIITYSIGGAYYANLTVGTPPQQQVVILDTGSSDLYFDAASAPACQTDGPYECRGGTFSPGKSSTYDEVLPAPAFDTRYGDGSTASGPFGRDTICLADTCVTNAQFGVATQVKSTTGYAIGLLGLGYSQNEATHHEYPNIPEVLVNADVINSRLYSIYLNDLGAETGNILFGGIDQSKYSGPLQMVDLLPNALTAEIDQFITTVTALSTVVDGERNTVWSGGSAGVEAYTANDEALPVLLDTGSSAWNVPESYYPYIVQNFPYIGRNGLCPCSAVDPADKLIVEFAGKIKIEVPASEFIVPIYNRTTNDEYEYPNGKDQCIFMIVPSKGTGMGFDTLGDAVLRSMYVVFDMDNGQMGLAQANLDSSAAPDIVEVPAGPGGIAKVVGNERPPPPQSSTWPIAPQLNATANYVASPAKTTVGEVTGVGAIPADAQTGAAQATSTGASVHVVVPPLDWSGAWTAAAALVMAALGAGLVL